jgi:protein TonB
MKILKLVLMILFILSCTTIAQEKLDKMPSIKGGITELAKNIKYPESAKKEGIMGKVMVKAIIDENGKVIETEVLKGVNAELDEAAVKAVKLTKFEAGVMDGKNVKAEVTIPISFKLDDCKKKS